jgi:hypothetical protein
MCDYSLHSVRSRPAQVGDTLTTCDFGTGTRGFAASEDPAVAVCVLPGTELAFSKNVSTMQWGFLWSKEQVLRYTAAIFRQVNKGVLHTHHDGLEFPDGSFALLTELREGQQAEVLQLPAQPTTDAEREAQRRVEYAG